MLSVLGTELLGARIGARFALGSGPSSRRVELAALTYQPEAAGDWHLWALVPQTRERRHLRRPANLSFW